MTFPEMSRNIHLIFSVTFAYFSSYFINNSCFPPVTTNRLSIFFLLTRFFACLKGALVDFSPSKSPGNPCRDFPGVKRGFSDYPGSLFFLPFAYKPRDSPKKVPRGTPWGVLIFWDSPGKTKVIP